MNRMVCIEKISNLNGLHQGVELPDWLDLKEDAAWFNPSTYLGEKGHKYYSDSVKYVLSAANLLGLDSQKKCGKSGVFIASNSIDFSVRKDILKAVDTDEAPIGAAYAPNCSVNIAAGILSQKFGYNGATFTFTGGDDAAIMALWQAHKCISQGDLDRIIVGQVEHQDGYKYLSGSNLWLLKSEFDGDFYGKIKGIFRFRCNENGSNILCFPLPDNQLPIFLIGEDSFALNLLGDRLTSNKYYCEQVHSDCAKMGLHKDLYLYFMLGLMCLQKINCNIFLVSKSGHIFYFQLNHEEKNHVKARKYLHYQRVGL